MEKLQEIICPVCATAIKDEIASCPRCETPHHPDCWDYAGGCAIFGCDSRGWLPASPQELSELQLQLNSWNWSFRYHWIFYVIMTTSLMVAFTSAGLMGLVKGLISAYTLTGFWLAIRGAFLALSVITSFSFIGGVFGYFIFLIPSVFYQYRLEQKTDQSLKVPKNKVLDVSNRLTMPKTASVIRSIYSFLRTVTTTLLITNLLAFFPLLFVVNLPRDFYAGLIVFFFFLFIVRAILLPLFSSPMEARHEYLVTVQNRMLASFKGKKK